MALNKPKKGQNVGDSFARIRIVITSNNLKKCEKVCNIFVARSKKNQLTFRGPRRLPTKTLRITTRKSPCGEGTNTYDRFQMRIHKRVFDIEAPADMVRGITQMEIDSGVDVELELQE